MHVLVECEAGAGIVQVLKNNGFTCDYSYLGEYGSAADAAERYDYDIIVLSKNLFQEIVRRTKEYATPEINIGKLRIDTKKRTVMVDGKIVRLTGKEYSLLEILATNRGKVLTKRMIRDHLYPDGKDPSSNIVDVFLCHVRDKISDATGGENYIRTVRKHGHMIMANTSEDAGGSP